VLDLNQSNARFVFRDDHECGTYEEFVDRHEGPAKYRGALLGLAVGDALGTTLEFKRPGTFPESPILWAAVRFI